MDFLLFVITCRLLDVFFGARTYNEIKLNLVFEHFNQDLSQYILKAPSGLDADTIRVIRNKYLINNVMIMSL